MDYRLRPYQIEALDRLRQAARSHRRVIFTMPTGCHGYGTPILMYDGSLKSAEVIEPGDQLMGPDSQPRTVLALCRGDDELYRVTPIKGESFVVNRHHILSLKHNDGRVKRTVDFSLNYWLKASKNFRHVHKLWRTNVDFEQCAAPLPIEPYFLGVLIGDGSLTRGVSVCKPDIEIEEECVRQAQLFGLHLRIQHDPYKAKIYHLSSVRRGLGENPLTRILRSLGLFGKRSPEKFVPSSYLLADESARRALLAGLFDTDGYHDGNGVGQIVTASPRLASDIVFLSRSLGLAAYAQKTRKGCNGWIRDYWSISLSGELSQLPIRIPRKKPALRQQKKNVLVTGFDVEPVGRGEFAGFVVNGDRRYLAGDFTVHHNSGKTLLACELVKTARDKLKHVLFLAYSKEVIDQTSAKLSDYGLEHGIIKSGYHPSLMATTQVASVMTLIRRELPFAPDLILVDEAHKTMARSWRRIIDAYPKSWVIGLTATPCRQDGKGLGDVYEELIIGASMRNLIVQGHLVPTKVYAPSAPDLRGVRTKAGDYDEEDLEKRVNVPKLVGDIVEHWQRLAEGKRTVSFATTIAHSNHIVEQFRQAGIPAEHLDGETPMWRRTEVLQELKDGVVLVVCVVGLLQEGWDAPWVECMIQGRPTKSLRWYLQTIGRSLRPHVGKDYALVLDHAGNTLRHGFVHEDVEWTLERSKSVDKERAQKREAKGLREWVCPNCHYVNQPPVNHEVQRVCESCGLRHVRVNGVAVKNGRLEELREAHRQRPQSEKERLWKQSIAIAVARDQRAGAAAHIYKAKTGCWPRKLSHLSGVEWKRKARDVWPGFDSRRREY